MVQCCLSRRPVRILNYKGYKVDTYLYREIEVERRAWERYGGPEAFEAV